MTYILSLLRTSWYIKIAQIYYATQLHEENLSSSIVSYSNALIPIPNLSEQKTYQINLNLPEEILFGNLRKSNRSQIKQAAAKSFTHIIQTDPTNQDLLLFQKFYNHFAKNKHTHRCNAFHLKTLQLLRDQHALVLTKILGEKEETLCYRIYLTDRIRALTLYSASHYRRNNAPDIKRLYSLASRYLLWKNILWFKKNGHAIYDLGSLTTDENIRQFKMGFGGEIVKAYSGYVPKNRMGKFILWIRKVKMNSRWKHQ
ncbi:hypothetical protein ACQKE5_11480 [Paenisporosarcina sp. NPDC076898]|uniref:hypothetical protein n=1 Tax=Paenisporosarcina sp. NPDC076898 TaxID=3390603 RepID=UPI003D061342